jgi:hypothetical protein
MSGRRTRWSAAGLALLSACTSTDRSAADASEQPVRSAPAATSTTGPTAAEPGRAAAAPSEAGDAAFAELLSGMSIGYDARARTVSAEGWVNMRSGLIEVFACTPEGKTHEAVVALDCVPSGLHAGLLALGLQPGRPVEAGTGDEYRPPTGDGVIVEVEWSDEAGELRRARAEDWIWHVREERPMPRTAWIFAGSFVQQPTAGGGRGTYAADYVKSLVTTYHDASSILENPYPEGADDTMYYANERAVPPVGTPVTVYFSPAPEEAEGAAR